MAASSPASSCSFFLLKSEPSEYSVHQLQKDGREEWTGVRSYAARNHLRAMKKGDRAFYYHSSCSEPAIVGTCRIARTAQPDPTSSDDNNNNKGWVSVLVEFEAAFDDATIVTMKELRVQAKKNPVIANMTLLRQSRLSVMPLSIEEWNAVLDLQTRKERGEHLLLEALAPSTNNDNDDNDQTKKNRTTKQKAAASTAAKKQTAPSAPPPLIDQNAANDPGYCSDPTRALSAQQLNAIQNKTATKITEKDLGLKGRQHLWKLAVNGNDDNNEITLCFLYQGKKFVGKDRHRLIDMVEAYARQQQHHPSGMAKKTCLLLAANAGICRRNTLPQLVKDGIVVQRLMN